LKESWQKGANHVETIIMVYITTKFRGPIAGKSYCS